ncbi:MAG TPA: hypothetical protein VGC79_07570 [Polyangiaceae bacterium]
MGHIAEELASAIKTAGARARISPNRDSSTLLSELRARFGAADQSGELWERLSSSFGYRDDDAWRLASDFTSGQRCLLLVPPRFESTVFEFDDGVELTRVLEQCSGFEFYVTDDGLSYVLCANHHDYLIAAGSAKIWLEGLVPSRS